MKLADALLRRKELNMKVEQLKTIKQADIFQMKVERRQITETIDDIRADVPLLEASQVTSEYDFYAHRLRVIDAAIQKMNWITDIDVHDKVWEDFKK